MIQVQGTETPRVKIEQEKLYKEIQRLEDELGGLEARLTPVVLFQPRTTFTSSVSGSGPVFTMPETPREAVCQVADDFRIAQERIAAICIRISELKRDLQV